MFRGVATSINGDTGSSLEIDDCPWCSSVYKGVVPRRCCIYNVLFADHVVNASGLHDGGTDTTVAMVERRWVYGVLVFD